MKRISYSGYRFPPEIIRQELRQAYMRLILENVAVGHHEVRLEGSPTILERLAQKGAAKSCAEVLSFAQGWRPRQDSNLRPSV
jgi:hypothetical protein